MTTMMDPQEGHNADILTEEKEHLQEVLAYIDGRTKELQKKYFAMEDQIVESKRHANENYILQREGMDKALFGGELEYRLGEMDHLSEEYRVLKNVRHTPWFGRLDLAWPGEEVQALRIGVRDIKDLGSYKTYVLDWRVPVASLYYGGQVGPCTYQVQGRAVKVDLEARYRVHLAQNQVKKVVPVDSVISDELLREVLSEKSTPHMKNMVQTIQTAQNAIIRFKPKSNVVVFGPPGSGKTAIAIHRAAWLMYVDPRITADKILLITDNEQLAAYLSEILPSLQEENISCLNFLDICALSVGYRAERFLSFDYEDAPLDRLRQGDNPAMVGAIQRFAKTKVKALAPYLNRQDLLGQYGPGAGKFHMGVEQFRAIRRGERERLLAESEGSTPLATNTPASLLVSSLSEGPAATEKTTASPADMASAPSSGDKLTWSELLEAQEEGDVDEELAQKRQAKQDMIQNLLNPETIYQDFLAYLQEEGIPLDPPALGVNQAPRYDRLDLTIMAWLTYLIFGRMPGFMEIKQVLVDEMQDYTLLEMQFLHEIFRCPKTILGDVHQAIRYPQAKDYEDQLARLFCLDGDEVNEDQVAHLQETYRSTYEIAAFCACLIGDTKTHPFHRHGKAVEVMACQDQEEEIQKFLAYWQEVKEAGYQSLALLAPNRASRLALYRRLKAEGLEPKLQVELPSLPEPKPITSLDEEEGEETGTEAAMEDAMSDAMADNSSNLEVYLFDPATAKGMEFDAVFIADATPASYPLTTLGRNSLYVAAGRAMHRLAVAYCGEPSPCLDPALESLEDQENQADPEE